MQERYEIALQLAFLAGRWRGQVDLEEHYDREQYSSVVPEAVNSRKMCLPQDLPSVGRTCRINLRSDKWREGVKKETEKYMNEARAILGDQQACL